jgi:GMP synthase-like glutamine amidotransferase
MRAHVLQHVPFEDIGSIASWLAAHDAQITYTRFYQKPLLPDPKTLDLIIAMGGPMSVNDELELPWLPDEKRFIRAAIENGKPVLGICLGAQLIASALGSRVYRNPLKEIGWFPIEATPGAAEVFRFPPTCEVLHWHGETFDLPANAVRLAKSTACENQAFQIGRNVLALQFHLETTQESLKELAENCAHELVPGPYVQSKYQLWSAQPETYSRIHDVIEQVLSYLTLSSPAKMSPSAK